YGIAIATTAVAVFRPKAARKITAHRSSWTERIPTIVIRVAPNTAGATTRLHPRAPATSSLHHAEEARKPRRRPPARARLIAAAATPTVRRAAWNAARRRGGAPSMDPPL